MLTNKIVLKPLTDKPPEMRFLFLIKLCDTLRLFVDQKQHLFPAPCPQPITLLRQPLNAGKK